MSKVMVNGVVRDIKSLNFSTMGEPWAEYQLEDGRVVRIKFVMTHIFDTGEKDALGAPIFSFNGTPVFAVHD